MTRGCFTRPRPVGPDNDGDLLVQMAEGDSTALAELYDRYSAILLTLAQNIIGPSCEAEELVQDIFLRLWRRAPTWQPGYPRSLRTWLVLRTRTAAIALLRQAPELGSFGQTPTLLPEQWRPTGRFDPDQIDDLRFGQLRATTQGALGALSPIGRRVIDLCFFEGLERCEVARRLNLTPKAVAHHIAQIQQFLQHQPRPMEI